MPIPLRLSPLFLTAGFLFCLGELPSLAQRSCRAVRCKRSPSQPASAEVRIRITDETGGRQTVTYDKVFKLNHIPPRLRERYIQHLMDSLTNFEDENEKGWTKTVEESYAPVKPRLLASETPQQTPALPPSGPSILPVNRKRETCIEQPALG